MSANNEEGDNKKPWRWKADNMVFAVAVFSIFYCSWIVNDSPDVNAKNCKLYNAVSKRLRDGFARIDRNATMHLTQEPSEFFQDGIYTLKSEFTQPNLPSFSAIIAYSGAEFAVAVFSIFYCSWIVNDSPDVNAKNCKLYNAVSKRLRDGFARHF